MYSLWWPLDVWTATGDVCEAVVTVKCIGPSDEGLADVATSGSGSSVTLKVM